MWTHTQDTHCISTLISAYLQQSFCFCDTLCHHSLAKAFKSNGFLLFFSFSTFFPHVSAKQQYSWGVIRLMLVLSKCWLLRGPDRPCVFLRAFWGCESESSPMVLWPLTLRGRSHQMWSVCWDSGEGQLGLTRGGPVSPNCHREHGQRGSVSTVINHTPSLSLSLSLSLTPIFSFSHSLFHTVSFCQSLTLPHSLSLPFLLSAFVFLSLFLFFYLRYPLFDLGDQIFPFQSHTVHAFSFPLPSHIHILTFLL